MRRNRKLLGERTLLYTPIGLSLVDELTGRPPIGRIEARLQLLSERGDWVETGIQPRFTASGALMYPNLGRTADVSGPPRAYRIVLKSEFYRPFYAKLPAAHVNSEGLRFRAFPFNDQNPLSDGEYARAPESRDEYRFLFPAVNYPFPSHLRVVRGFVGEPRGNGPVADATIQIPVADASVELGVQKDRVLTNESGEFALPIRWLTTSTTTSEIINAGDEKIDVNFVAGLGSYAAITIDGDPAKGEPTVFKVKSVDIDKTKGELSLTEPVGLELPIGTAVRLTSFNLHAVHERTGRKATQPVKLSNAFNKRQTITLNSV